MCVGAVTLFDYSHWGGQLGGTEDIVSDYACVLRDRASGQWGRNMTASDTPKSAAEQKSAERLKVARSVYDALAAQDADRVITLCDIRGKLIARHDLRPEKDDPLFPIMP